MPCICGEKTCVCFYVCACQPQNCFCQACIRLRDPQQQAIMESPSKQNHGQNKSRSRKKSAQSDRSNEQMSSLVNDSPPGQSQMIQSLASVSDQRRQTLGSTPATETPKPSPNDYPTLIKQLNQPTPPSNYDPHAEIKRQLSQPAPPSNYDSHPILKRKLSEPPMIPLSSSIFHKNPSSTGGYSLSSVGNKNPYLPSTSKTGSSAAPSTSGLNKDFKSGNSTNSISKKVPTTSSDTNRSCANIEYIKKASDKALPSYESFSSRFTTPISDENNRNFGSTISTSQNRDSIQTSTEQPDRPAEIHTPLYLETSGESSSSCSNSGSQSLHSPDTLPLQLSPQDHPLNLSLSADDKHKISILHSSELSTRSPSPVPTKQQRTDTMEFSHTPTSEDDNQNAEYFSGGASATFSTRQMPLSWDSTAEGFYPKTRSESTSSTSGSSAYTSCTIQNPSQYTVIPQQFESLMDTGVFSKNFDENLSSSCPSSALPTSAFFAPPQISHSSQDSATNIIPHCNDPNDGKNSIMQTTPLDLHNLKEIQNSFSDSNRFSETPENPYLEHKVFSTSCEQTSLTDRPPVIVSPSSQQSPQSTSAFSACQATNQVNIPYQAQSHHASSSSFPSSRNMSEGKLLASRTSNESQTTPQASYSFQPISSDVNMVPASSIAPLTESLESYDRSGEHLPHHSQSSTLQSASCGISPSRSTARYRDDEKGKNNDDNRSKKKLSK